MGKVALNFILISDTTLSSPTDYSPCWWAYAVGVVLMCLFKRMCLSEYPFEVHWRFGCRIERLIRWGCHVELFISRNRLMRWKGETLFQFPSNPNTVRFSVLLSDARGNAFVDWWPICTLISVWNGQANKQGDHLWYTWIVSWTVDELLLDFLQTTLQTFFGHPLFVWYVICSKTDKWNTPC